MPSDNSSRGGLEKQQATVMVVDDEEDVLRIVKSALARYGHRVETFADPLDALNHFVQNPDQYMLVLSDVRMPGMSGVALAQKIREKHAKVKIFLMTAFEENNYEIKQGMPPIRIDEFIRKPFMLTKLCEIIDKHADTIKQQP